MKLNFKDFVAKQMHRKVARTIPRENHHPAKLFNVTHRYAPTNRELAKRKEIYGRRRK
jgi:hypothetical protein